MKPKSSQFLRVFGEFKPRKCLAVLALIIPILCIGCDPILSQDAKDLFANGKLPRHLEAFRTQIREFSLSEKEKIIDRAQRDAQRTDLLRVAIIDSGTDLAHKDLIPYLEYKVVNDRIVGSGYDFMGNTPFGSSVYIDPTLFAYSAESITQDGKIVDSGVGPLRQIEADQKLLGELIVEAIRKDPVLNKSAFSKIPPESFTLLGVLSLAESLTTEELKQDPKRIYFSENQTGELKPDEIRDIKVALSDFKPSLGNHRPRILDVFLRLEHGVLFGETLLKAIEQFKVQSGIEKRLDNVKSFLVARGRMESTDSVIEMMDEHLKRGLAFVVFGYEALDPFFPLLEFARTHGGHHGNVNQSLSSAMKTVKDIVESAEKTQLAQMSQKERTDFNQFKESVVFAERMVSEMIALNKDPEEMRRLRILLRNEYFRRAHPYLDSKSVKNQHGTHVAGTVAAAKLENLRLFPIRVTTQSVSISESTKTELIEEFRAKVIDWKNTELGQALFESLSTEYTQGLRTQVEFETVLLDYLKNNSLNLVFIRDFIKAVEVVGEQKIKLANVSLGTLFEKKHSKERQKQSMLEDYFAEFVRFLLGETIQQKAPSSLFLIASGNDKAWVDGVSRTAFPVVITSHRSREVARRLGLPEAPNNSVKNILAVGSINPAGPMTGFSNLIIDPNTPQIFSTGEEIVASVPDRNRGAFAESIGERMLMFAGRLFAIGTRNRDGDFSNLERISEASVHISQAVEAFSAIRGIQLNESRKAMSGTSMATPSATQLVARMIDQEMKARGLTAQEMFVHPDFQPDKLIDRVFATAQNSPFSNRVVSIRMFKEGLEVMDGDENSKKRKAVVERIFAPVPEAKAVVSCRQVHVAL